MFRPSNEAHSAPPVFSGPARQPYGLLAQFETVPALYEACQKIRDKGFSHWDSYAPFPIHGLDKAMGLGPSKLPWLVGATAFVFGTGGFLTWSWMNAVDYKFVIAGKPFYSWPAYFLPGFECAVLSAAAMCLIGMLLLNGLPRFYHPLCRSDAFAKATDDKFFICIQESDPKFHLQKTADLLQELGATHVELVEE